MSYDHVRYLRGNQTPAERRLWTQLRAKRLSGARFRRQQASGPFIADFYCHAARLVIEVDGPDHDLKFEKDKRRTEWLRRYGLSVLRFTNEDVMRNIDGVLCMIEEAIARVKSLPQPLPWGGEMSVSDNAATRKAICCCGACSIKVKGEPTRNIRR